MLLHRVAGHIRQHDWFAILIDLIVVVVGVFLGLQASNWNDARLAEEDEVLLLERLVIDLKAIENEAKAKAEFIGESQLRIEDTAAMVRGKTVAPERDPLQSGIESILAMPGTLERSTAYLELLAGGMRRISDDRLREAIVRHDGALLDAKESQAIRRTISEPYLQKLQRLRFLLDEAEPAKAIQLSGGELEVRLALKGLNEIYSDERAQLQYVLKRTQRLLGLLGGK